jgi:hypothetical protein
MFHYGDWQRERDGKRYQAVSIAAGLSYSRLFNASFNERALFVFNNPSTEVFNKNDISYTASAAFKTSPRWGYSVRYTRSFNLLTNDPFGQLRWQGYFISFASHLDF